MRVLIADDEPVARKGLRALLAKESDVEIVGEATTGEETQALVQSTAPDVLFDSATILVEQTSAGAMVSRTVTVKLQVLVLWLAS